MIAGSVFAVFGGVSALAGTGMLIAGNHQAKKARENRPQFTLSPSNQGQGAMARLGGNF
jgi:hypothetical protein